MKIKVPHNIAIAFGIITIINFIAAWYSLIKYSDVILVLYCAGTGIIFLFFALISHLLTRQ